MNTIQVIGFIAGIFTGISLLPQLFKIIKEKKTEDISVWMLIILMAGLALWVVYGIQKNDLPIIITNSFSVVINIIILFFRFRYKKNK
ncbi:MAG: SemiSWEET transporter [Chitinophagaceae bacterium]